MSNPADLVDLTRGGRRECLHRGHAVIVDTAGAILEARGDPDLLTYPRSSAKPIQALPLATHPAVAARLSPQLRNRAGLAVGQMRSLI